MQNLSAPFIFQEECRMKIEHVLFSSAFFQNYGFKCRKIIFNVFHDPIFGTTEIVSLKTDRVNEP